MVGSPLFELEPPHDANLVVACIGWRTGQTEKSGASYDAQMQPTIEGRLSLFF